MSPPVSANALAQSLALLIAAPLLAGWIKKAKAILQNRRGASIIQPAYDLLKNFRKGEAVSETSSWILRVTPLLCFAATFAASLFLPLFFVGHPQATAGDLIALVFLLAVPRFFMALAGLDAGSAFGGMGSSREMMIASTAEPALILSLLTLAAASGTSQAGGIVLALAEKGWAAYHPGMALAAVALFLVMLAECARLPVDNPATHLELTMVHEAMLLEYSGRSLALMEWAQMTKLALFLSLLANLFFPWGVARGADPLLIAAGFILWLLKLGALSLFLALVESSTAKLRLFRVPDFLGTAFVLALLALLSQGILRLGL